MANDDLGWGVVHTELKMEFSSSVVLVTTKLSVQWRNVGPVTAPLILDGVELTISRLLIDGIEAKEGEAIVEERVLRLHLGERPQAIIEVTTQPRLRQPHELGVVVQPGLINTHLEPTGMRRVTYCLDRPSERSTYDVTLVADAEFPTLLAGGALVDAGQLPDGRAWRRFVDPVAKPTYLFSALAAKMGACTRVISTTSTSTEITVVAPGDPTVSGAYALDVLESAMKFDDATGGLPYDLAQLTMASVQGYPDATEYHGLMFFEPSTLLLDDAGWTDDDLLPILANVSHEYFHHTRGNRITVSAWDQLALKEGLTVLAQNDFRELLDGPSARAAAVAFLRRVQYPEESLLAVPVVRGDQPAASEVYNRTTYLKGAEIFRMLRALVGPTAWRSATDAFHQDFDLSHASVSDFVAALQRSCPELSESISSIARWFFLVGRPKVSVTVDEADGQRVLRLSRSDALLEETPVGIPIEYTTLAPEGTGPQGVQVAFMSGRTLDVVLPKESRGVVSLLRGLSAPIDLTANYTDEELGLIVSDETDVYARVAAVEKLSAVIVDATRSGDFTRRDTAATQLVAALGVVMERESDHATLATLLQLPSEIILGDRDYEIDVDGIHTGVVHLARVLGGGLGERLDAVLKSATYGPRSTTPSDRATRQLIDACLTLLLHRGKPEDFARATALIHGDDWTLATRALAQSVAINHPDVEAMLDETSRRWSNSPKLFDRWIRAQSAAPRPETISRVAALVRSNHYLRSDRSRVMAVWFPFCTMNRVAFHDPSGAGYKLFIDEVETLSTVSPQLVLRLVPELLQFQRFDTGRRELLRTQLERVRDFHGLGEFALGIVDSLLASA
ncbi:MAG: aminopeptidase N C-terminal domain-containing protein [Actinomycetota bacterium]